MPLSLPDDTRTRLAEAIRAYVRDEWDVEIGNLKAGLFVEYLLAQMGPVVYNRAITDAQRHLAAVAAELDLTLHEPEP